MRSGKLTKTGWIAAASAIAVVILFACTLFKNQGPVSSAQLSTAQGSSGSVAHRTWTQYGGSADQSKYVELKEITKKNVNQLQVAWCRRARVITRKPK